MEKQAITINGMYEMAKQATASGVPVDWESIADYIYCAASNHISKLETEIRLLKNQPNDDE